MKKKIANFVYKAAKLIGIFHLCRYKNKSGLRILCYHGLWVSDCEHFGDALFMSIASFRQRMLFLKNLEYNVLSLDEAINAQNGNRLPDNSVVITIDDGFYSTYSQMLPILEQHFFPATIYVTTYYVENSTPIYPLMLRYIVESSKALNSNTELLKSNFDLDLPEGTTPSRSLLVKILIEKLNATPIEDQRHFIEKLAKFGHVQIGEVVRTRQFELMNKDEVIDSASRGFDIQLHTHRHRISHNCVSTAVLEIRANRNSLSRMTDASLKHFCYPSGIHSETDFPALISEGIVSATTCMPGLNYSSTHRLQLMRFLDAESVTEIEFEAELVGFNDFIRKVKRLLKE